jgi:hypothetical protein
MLLKFRRIQDKFRSVVEMLYQDGIQHFLEKNKVVEETLKRVIDNFSPQNFYKDIDRELFWKINKILHDGVTMYQRDDAVQCYRIADIVLGFLGVMDLNKRKQTP